MKHLTSGQKALSRGSPWSAAAHRSVARSSLSGLTWLRNAAMPSAVTSRHMTPTTRPSTTATTAGSPLAVAGVDLGRAADDGALGLAGFEQAPQELRDREGALERLGAGRDLPAAVADRDGVLGEQPHERLGPAAGGGREELLDDPPGGGLVDLGAGLAVRDVLLGAVEDLLAGGLGDVEDLGDLPVRVVEGLPQHVHRPLVGGEALHEGEDRVRDRFALLGGVGRAEHRVPGEQRLGQPLAHVGLAPGPRRGELVEAQVGEDLRQPGLGDLDAVDVGGLPAQERLLHGVLGLARPSRGGGRRWPPGGAWQASNRSTSFTVKGHGPDPSTARDLGLRPCAVRPYWSAWSSHPFAARSSGSPPRRGASLRSHA